VSSHFALSHFTFTLLHLSHFALFPLLPLPFRSFMYVWYPTHLYPLLAKTWAHTARKDNNTHLGHSPLEQIRGVPHPQYPLLDTARKENNTHVGHSQLEQIRGVSTHSIRCSTQHERTRKDNNTHAGNSPLEQIRGVPIHSIRCSTQHERTTIHRP
jgi:hypothetical protein